MLIWMPLPETEIKIGGLVEKRREWTKHLNKDETKTDVSRREDKAAYAKRKLFSFWVVDAFIRTVRPAQCRLSSSLYSCFRSTRARSFSSRTYPVSKSKINLLQNYQNNRFETVGCVPFVIVQPQVKNDEMYGFESGWFVISNKIVKIVFVFNFFSNYWFSVVLVFLVQTTSLHILWSLYLPSGIPF